MLRGEKTANYTYTPGVSCGGGEHQDESLGMSYLRTILVINCLLGDLMDFINCRLSTRHQTTTKHAPTARCCRRFICSHHSNIIILISISQYT